MVCLGSCTPSSISAVVNAVGPHCSLKTLQNALRLVLTSSPWCQQSPITPVYRLDVPLKCMRWGLPEEIKGLLSPLRGLSFSPQQSIPIKQTRTHTHTQPNTNHFPQNQPPPKPINKMSGCSCAAGACTCNSGCDCTCTGCSVSFTSSQLGSVR